METKTEVTKFIPVVYARTPPETLKKAADECDNYTFQKAGDQHYVCIHGEKAYVIIVKPYPDSRKSNGIGCSCGDWNHRCTGNEICKHLATFIKRSQPPTAKLDREVARDLMGAGWINRDGGLYPPAKGTSDSEGEDQASSDHKGSDPIPVADPPKKDPIENATIDEEEVEMKETISTPEMDKTVARLIAEAEQAGAKDIDPEYVATKMSDLKRFRVTGIEAERSVVSAILRSQGIKRPKGEKRANVLAPIDSITSDGVWLSLRVKVVDLWDNEHDSIRQVGLVGDETGTTKFVSWEKSNLALLEEGKCYSIENVVTNEHEGSFSVNFTRNTVITAIPDEIEVAFTTAEFTGIMVNIQNGSGLIKRCSICNRAMQRGTCKEHGNVEGTQDLRIKATLDDGTQTQNILLNRERTEVITGITLEDALDMAREAFDADVVVEKMKSQLIGQEFTISGRDVGDTILIENVVENDAVTSKEEVKALIKEA